MNQTAVALVVGAALIGGAILLDGNSTPTTPGRYQIAPSQGGVARLDTTTGELVNCFRAECVIVTDGKTPLPKLRPEPNL